MSHDFHPAASIFPLLDGAALTALVEDISNHGLLEPIVLYEGKVLDGRNRLRACELANVKPQFVEWDADGMTPVEWVVSKNLHRRHLTVGQRAALAIDLLPHLEQEAKERKAQAAGQPQGVKSHRPKTDEESGRSDEKTAELVGVGRTTVAHTKTIQKRDPKVVNQMRAGELNVAQAARAVGLHGRGSGGDGQPVIGDRKGKTARGYAKSTYYGRGDKFQESTEPLRRYLRGWSSRNFEFRHVNPREARQRVKILDQLSEGIAQARVDLVTRDVLPVGNLKGADE